MLLKLLLVIILNIAVTCLIVWLIYDKTKGTDMGKKLFTNFSKTKAVQGTANAGWDEAVEILNVPTPGEADFEFKKRCREKGGVIHLNAAMDPSNPFQGTLLACDQRGEFGEQTAILMSEIREVQDKIRSGVYVPKTEKERLELYFSLVYPNAPVDVWKGMSEAELQGYYKNLEFYYKLPVEIMPETKVEVRRTEDERFYRMPGGVVLDQDPNRKGITTPYIEVTRFGPAYALMRDPRLFNATYYYPVRGSGLFLPLGKTLVSYNKVHALKQLDTLNTQILTVAGRDFQSFLKKDSDAMWSAIKKANPAAQKSDYWVRACVVDKHATAQGANCSPYLGAFTTEVWYIPAALDKIVNEMSSGYSLRIDTRKQADGKMKDVKVYYGLGDSGDKLLAQIARDRGYNTLQFIREAQMSLEGDAVVGNEMIDLVEPSYSQANIMRLNPFSRPYTVPFDPFIQPHTNYLLDQTTYPVTTSLISEGVYKPWSSESEFNIVVPKRN